MGTVVHLVVDRNALAIRWHGLNTRVSPCLLGLNVRPSPFPLISLLNVRPSPFPSPFPRGVPCLLSTGSICGLPDKIAVRPHLLTQCRATRRASIDSGKERGGARGVC